MSVENKNLDAPDNTYYSYRPASKFANAPARANGLKTYGWTLAVAFCLLEEISILITVRSALFVVHPSGTLGIAGQVFCFGLPLLNCAVLTKRRFYAFSTLFFDPLRPLALTAAWAQAFGVVIVLAAIARTWEGNVFQNGDLIAPEIAATFIGGLAILFVIRVTWLFLRSKFIGLAVQRVVFFGELDQSRRLIARLRAEPGICLVSAINCWTSDINMSVLEDGHMQTREYLISLLQRERIDAIVVALPQMAEGLCSDVLMLAQQFGTTALAMSDSFGNFNFRPEIANLGRLPVLELASGQINEKSNRLKRAEDLFSSVCLLLAVAPVMVLIAIAIRLDSPGPILFRQRRIGRFGQMFDIFKFRTMTHSVNPRPGDIGLEPGDTLQTKRNDTRVTRVGAFLRRHSFDELPQLLNVMRGEMSIVGPRPHAVAMTVEGHTPEALVSDYPARLTVRPGITGWAQINGQRGILDCAARLQERVDHDLYYVENWSLALDLRIIAKTIMCLFHDNGAF